MPLPEGGPQPWPPKHLDPWTHDLQEAAAWYAGNPAALQAHYGGPTTTPSRQSEPPGLLRRAARFWSRTPTQGALDTRQRLHVPLASDIAAASADLLFGDPPALRIPAAHEDQTDGDATAAKATEGRIEALDEQLGLANLWLEAAETCAGIGAVYLRPAWDHDVADHPLLGVVQADSAVPEFRWGRLSAVTFWRVLATNGDEVLRWLEHHERGRVLHGLYQGTRSALGHPVPLTEHEATASTAKIVDEEGAIALPAGLEKRLLPSYVPNVLPNRKHRGKPWGRSDTQGAEGLMDALDEAWSSWMRDIRLGKLRVIVPDEFLTRGPRGTNGQARGAGARFDADQEIFTPLEMDPKTMEGAGITPVEFKLRVEEHARTCAELVERIIAAAGYSPQTFGIGGDGAVATATEVRAREGKSIRTRARKSRYFAPALADAVEALLAIDRAEFGGQAEPMRPQVVFPETAEVDAHRVAETVDMLRRAQAASTETLVRMVQPELEGDQLQAEVTRIQDEQGLSVVDPTGGLPEGGAA